MDLSYAASALFDPCKYCPSCITLLPVLILRNKNSVVGNFSTSKDPLVSSEGVRKGKVLGSVGHTVYYNY